MNANKKQNKWVQTILFPIVTALIWGTAFVAQREGAAFIGPLAFNGLRGIVASLVLGLLCVVKNHGKKTVRTPAQKKQLLLGGLVCGALLSAASNFQQLGLAEIEAGKAGFITSLYIVLVPLLGMFLGRKVSGGVWFSIALAVVGLFFLCVGEGFTLAAGDLSVLICSLIFALHILCIDRFVVGIDSTELSCAQFVVVTISSLVLSFFTETFTAEQVKACLGQLLYLGIFSSGIAYTLQIAAQKAGDSVLTSLLMSLESLFSVIAGAVILGEHLSERELFGCAIMLTAVMLAQLPWERIVRRTKT